MDEVRKEIARAATTDASVLILGETGVGKELVARAIHEAGNRYGRAFVPVDCGALPDELAESELFGVRRGAFTGATQDRTGLFECADRGTIFLDEIGNMAARTQAKLLRVLQDRRIRRVGDVIERSIDVRVVSATNSRLDALRPDLVYRLNTLTISVPPLRQRPNDIPLLADYFVEQLNARYGRDSGFHPMRYGTSRNTTSPETCENLSTLSTAPTFRRIIQFIRCMSSCRLKPFLRPGLRRRVRISGETWRNRSAGDCSPGVTSRVRFATDSSRRRVVIENW
jgi:sigma54-dependent transcription regulator